MVAPRPRFILGAFFLSGFAGLLHEVVWAELLVLLIGGTAHAQAVTLAVFMGGLALGAMLLGRWTDRHGRPLRTYVLLELGVGAYALILPLLVAVTGKGYVALATRCFESPGLRFGLRLGLSILVILTPAILMGGTLPALARHLVRDLDRTRRRVADLYAVNSFGAVLGAGVAGFAALPGLGLHRSLALATLVNLASAAFVWPQARRERSEPGFDHRISMPRRIRRKRRTPLAETMSPAWLPLLALALSGFSAMGYEVIFTRIIALSFGASTYSFSVMLMAFVTGIGIGSTLVARLRVHRPLTLFAVCQLGVMASLLAATPLVARLPYLMDVLRIALQDEAWGFEVYQAGKAALCLAVLLLPTTCLGFGFPLVAQIQTRQLAEVGSRVGSTYGWNTVGNVLGATATALVLLPGLGLLGAFHFNLALNACAGLLILWVAHELAPARRIAIGALAGAVVGIYAATGIHWLDPINLAPNHLSLRTGPEATADVRSRALHPAASFAAWKRFFVLREQPGKLLFLAEDAHATILVAGDARRPVLYVDGKPDASLGDADLETQLLLAHAPLFLAPEARTLLVIGYGSGITAASALRHPIQRSDVVEISHSVLEADAFFSVHNGGVLSDPRVHVYEEDGVSFVTSTPRSYDVIISEPSNPWMAGVSNLFTREFFDSVRSKLKPDGVFTLWFHTYWQSDEMVQLVMRTLGAVFPSVVLVADNDFGNVMALASTKPLFPDFGAMERRFREPSVGRDLARIGISNLESLLSHYRISPQRFRRLVTPGPLNTVGHQRLEYGAPRAFFSGENSFLLERFDPLLQEEGEGGDSDLLLDRYLAWRRARGSPVAPKELLQAARDTMARGGHGTRVARALVSRAKQAAAPSR